MFAKAPNSNRNSLFWKVSFDSRGFSLEIQAWNFSTKCPESYIDVLWCVVFVGQVLGLRPKKASNSLLRRRFLRRVERRLQWTVCGKMEDCCSATRPMVLNELVLDTFTFFFVHRFFLCIFFSDSPVVVLVVQQQSFFISLNRFFFAGCLFWHTLTRMHMRKPHQLGSRFLTERNQSWCLRSCDCGVTMICYVHICSHTQPSLSIWDCSQLCFLQNASGLSQALGQYEATFGVRPLKVHTGVVDLLAISYWRGTLQSWSAIFEMGKARVHATWVFLLDLHYLF